MKKILIYTDVHFSQYSSILRSQGKTFSTRLEGIIDSLNWAEQTALDNECEFIICMGDFFDRSFLNAEELSALQSIKWVSLPHYFLVGNHEVERNMLNKSSAHALNLVPQIEVISDTKIISDYTIELAFLPYINESIRQPIENYLPKNNSNKKRIVFSHNDIKGIQYGAFQSTMGFELEDILENSDCFVNGHLHNGSWIVPNRVLNLGNLTGQNFTEDALQYKHNVLILNIEDNNYSFQFIENPYAFNFCKLGVINNNLPQLPKNCILSCATTSDKAYQRLQEILSNNSDVLSYKIIRERNIHNNTDSESTSDKEEFKPIDHNEQFRKHILETLGDNEIVRQEIEEILK